MTEEDPRSIWEILEDCIDRLEALARITLPLEEDDPMVVDFRKEALQIDKLQTNSCVVVHTPSIHFVRGRYPAGPISFELKRDYLAAGLLISRFSSHLKDLCTPTLGATFETKLETIRIANILSELEEAFGLRK